MEAYLKAHPDANSEVADVEDLVAQGRAGGPCPYYLTREMAAGADLVLMPYNYLVDARTRFGLKSIQWRGSVLIFDEAHNVEVGYTASHAIGQERTSGRGQAAVNTLCLAIDALFAGKLLLQHLGAGTSWLSGNAAANVGRQQ